MKLIILEGGDNLGKSLLIKGLCEYFNYDNVTIRHFGKPPKGLTPLEVLNFQFKCFRNEAELVGQICAKHVHTNLKYYEETAIWNRSHLGEYVYSQMFRGGNPVELKEKLLFFENYHFFNDYLLDRYLITLTATPEFFLSKEDGESFSKNIEQKTKELELFEEAHKFSLIKNKLLVKVDKETELLTGTEWRKQGPNIFRPKEDILNEVLNFIK
jgi:thymidylate kinase